MKPFLFSRRQRNYARFLVPAAYRHLSDGKKYLVFTLGAAEPIIRKKAVELESLLLERMRKGEPLTFKKYEIDLGRGVFKAEGKEDHEAMMKALEYIVPKNIGEKYIADAFNLPANVPEGKTSFPQQPDRSFIA